MRAVQGAGESAHSRAGKGEGKVFLQCSLGVFGGRRHTSAAHRHASRFRHPEASLAPPPTTPLCCSHAPLHSSSPTAPVSSSRISSAPKEIAAPKRPCYYPKGIPKNKVQCFGLRKLLKRLFNGDSPPPQLPGPAPLAVPAC